VVYQSSNYKSFYAFQMYVEFVTHLYVEFVTHIYMNDKSFHLKESDSQTQTKAEAKKVIQICRVHDSFVCM